jgi:hypothetical protein
LCRSSVHPEHIYDKRHKTPGISKDGKLGKTSVLNAYMEVDKKPNMRIKQLARIFHDRGLVELKNPHP